MASVVTEKLYPPVIGSSIPAFYEENGTAVIAVPFSMNRAVSISDISGFSLKIKTVQSNTFIKTLETSDVATAVSDRIVKFYWYAVNDQDFQKIKLGQYLKIQLAYLDNSGVVGYFSTVGIIKYTSKPTVFIEGLQTDANRIGTFRTNYTGVFETGEDKSERPYSYCFYLYDKNNGLIEMSGWKLHNTSINNIATETLYLNKSTDSYNFETALETNQNYFIQYGVRTINNLEIFSPLYPCIEPETSASTFMFDLIAENIFEEAYIKLSLVHQQNTPETLAEPVSIQICRAEKTDNFASWRTLKKVYFADYTHALNWTFKDLTVEQGIIYKYCFRQYNAMEVQSDRTESNEVMADFEDMFLWDGKKQIKIRFNPKVSSFKISRLESKMDTIGSRYPFIFRNGIVEYREFPIAGLVSYKADNNEMFMNHEEDLNIILGQHSSRTDGTPTGKNDFERSETLDSVGYNMRAERRFKMKLLEWLGDGKVKLFKSAAEGNYLVRLLNISLTPEDRLGRMLHNFSATAYEVETLSYENLVNLGFINTDEEEEREYGYETVTFMSKVQTILPSTINRSVKINNYGVYNLLSIMPSPNTESSNGGFFVRLGTDAADNKVYVQPGSFTLNTTNDTALPDVFFNVNDNLPLLSSYTGGDADLIYGAQTLVADAQLTYGYYSTVIKAGEFNNIDEIYVKNEICSFVGPCNKSFITQTSNSTTEEVLKFYILDFKDKGTPYVLYKNNGNYYENKQNTIGVNNFDKILIYNVYDNSDNLIDVCYLNSSNNFVSACNNSSSIRQLFLVDGKYYNNLTNARVEFTDFNDSETYRIFDENQMLLGLYDFKSCYSSYNSTTGDIIYTNRLAPVIDNSVLLIDTNNIAHYFAEKPVLNLNEFFLKSMILGNNIYVNAAYQLKVTTYKGE